MPYFSHSRMKEILTLFIILSILYYYQGKWAQEL